LYKGFGLALISNFTYWVITLGMVEKLNSYFKFKQQKYGKDFNYLQFLNKVGIVFGASTINSVITSLILYPLDTFKRHLQVNNSLGFNQEYSSFNQAVSKYINGGVVEMYRGFSIHLLSKAIPFTFLHYTIYLACLSQYGEI
jgi:hypothetical protein